MDLTRREFVIGMGLLVAGCAGTPSAMYSRPGPSWPAAPTRPEVHGPGVAVAPAQAVAQVEGGARGLTGISRSTWATRGAIAARLNPMNGVNRITVHHEGWTPVWFTDQGSAQKRLELIRRNHVERGWADIGYHYVIDRSGRVWEGRNPAYQGAHVREQNEHNIGVLVLGNFDVQRPSEAQMAGLAEALRRLMAYYNVPISRVYTHRELNSTTCPGRYLESRMVSLRRNGGLTTVMARR